MNYIYHHENDEKSITELITRQVSRQKWVKINTADKKNQLTSKIFFSCKTIITLDVKASF